MDSSQITNILNRYNELTYKCIFFDGPWGIGKSYAVDAADDKNRIAHISLSGIRTSEEIYSEIIDSVVGKMSISTIADKVVSSVIDIASTSELSKVNTAANIASGLMDKFVTKKSLLQAVLKKQNKCMIVVLDDFERVWDGIDITEVFRVVEFLSNQKNVKVAIIGDLTKLSGDINEKFEKYSERYIERTYTITDISADIEWDSVELNISKDFITEFRSLHHFTNLRSVIKAINFHNDLRSYLLSESKIIKEDNPEFWADLRLTAFALIIESIDGIELSKIGEDKTDDDDDTRFANSITRDFDSRIYTYLDKSRLGTMMFPYVRDYYETGDCKLSSFEGIYSIEPIHDILEPFYSDAETVRNELPKIRESMRQIESVSELIRKIKEYVVWAEICGVDTSDGINEFKCCLHKLLIKQVECGETNFKPVFYKLILDECKQLCPIVESEIQFAQQYMIDHWIDQLLRNTFTENEYNIAQNLYDYCRSEPYGSFIKQRLNDLLCDKVFPTESKSNTQLYTCQSILKTLHYLDDKKLQDYYEKLMDREDLDPVAKNRCNVVMNHLTD